MYQGKVHPSITDRRVQAAVEDGMIGLENPGFCLSCGADHDECEPDARARECYECGEHTVYGAEEVFLVYRPPVL